MKAKHLYSCLKIFCFPEKIASLPLENSIVLPPIQIRIKPINACNHNCSYCCYRSDNLQLGQDMNIKDMIPREKMSELIDNIIEMKVKSVTFSGGGEPLIYPYINETLQKLANSEVKFATLTNGTNLSGEIAEIFATYGSWVRISIDGWDDASYARYRNIKTNDFTKVINNIKNFAKIKKTCKVGAVIIIDATNTDHIYELTMKLRDCGVDNIKMSPCIISNDAEENNQYHKKFFNKAQDEISRAITDLADDNFDIINTYHLLDGKFNKDYPWCPYLQICPVIGADCNVYSCHDKAYNLNCGLLFSFKNTSFKDAWLANKEQFFKINPIKHCQHHCVANERNKTLIEYFNIEHGEFA